MGLEDGIEFGIPIGLIFATIFYGLIEAGVWIATGKGFNLLDLSLPWSRLVLVIAIICVIVMFIYTSAEE